MTTDGIVTAGSAVWYGTESAAYGTEASSYPVILSPLTANGPRVNASYTKRGDLYQADGGIVAAGYIPGRKQVRLTTSHYATYAGMGLIWKAVFGGAASTGAASGGLYPHDWTFQKDAADGLSVRIRDGSARGSLATQMRSALGCLANRAVFSFDAQGRMIVTIDWLAQDAGNKATAAAISAITNAGDNAIHIHHASPFAWNGSNFNFISGQIEINRNLQFRDVAGQATSARMWATELASIRASITADRIGYGFEESHEAADEDDFVLAFNDPAVSGQLSRFTLTDALVVEPPEPERSGFSVERETINFEPQAHTGAGLIFRQVNADSSAEAA